MKKLLFIFLFIPFLGGGMGEFSFALQDKTSGKQRHTIDSLHQLLNTAREDTNKINILNQLIRSYSTTDKEQAFKYVKVGLELSEKLKFKKGKADLLHNYGLIYHMKGDYEKALKQYNIALEIRSDISDYTGIAATQNNIAILFRIKGDYEKALYYYLESCRNEERKGNTKNLGSSYTNIGTVYYSMQNYDKSIEYYQKAMDILEKYNDKQLIAITLSNMGLVYDSKADYNTAIKYYENSLNLLEEIEDKNGVASNINNIGLAYENQKKYRQALKFYLKGLVLNKNMNYKEGIALSYNNIGSCYQNLGEYEKSLTFYNKGLQAAIEINSKERIKNSHSGISEIYRAMGNYQKALEHFELHSWVKDSIFNIESSKQIAEMQEKYESEKREKEIELLNKEKVLQATELNRQKIIIWSGAGGLILVIALAFFIYRSYRLKRKANILLAAQKQVIETKNKDITDSIYYAENIQKAILPPVENIKKALPDSFVLFKPKDIVSGDFYFFAQVNQYIIIAACDCTGHGVPGAFMSMIGNSLLNEIVNDRSVTNAAEVLDQLRSGVIHAFGKAGSTGEQKDGMDMALCAFMRDKDNGIVNLQFAGAYNPLYLIREGRLQQIKADKQPVGYHFGEEKHFTNNEIQLKKGDTIYIFSDGYQDQFGGPKGKKFMSKQFRQLFLDIQEMNMEEQKEHLDKTIEDWKGDEEQVDDILVIGVRV